ncbi:MAG: YbaB/EbfC family nucleoid-associated protein [Nitrospirae bacterium]|nr:MAG: YbaB/EbfC family nucleoid-associated protein [Nitrospirota bacterium]
MSKNPFGNMGNLIKQAQAVQERLGKIQEEVAAKTVEASAGGGMVTVTANGAMQITKVTIDPEVFQANDREMLQDLLVAASNEALRKAKALMAEEVKSLTGGLGIPGLSNLF